MKYSFIFLSLYLFNFTTLIAQSDNLSSKDQSMIFANYEVMPKYKQGSNQDLIEDIFKRIKYPMIEKFVYVDERIILNIEIDEFGNVDCPRIVRGDFPEIEKQLLDLIWDYKFEPGTFRGVPTRCQMYFPFRIKL